MIPSPFKWLLLALSLTLFGCDRYGDTHQYKLDATVLTVLSCDQKQEICRTKVVKGNKDKYSEVWEVAGVPKQGDTVYKLCSFKVIKQDPDASQIGNNFSSRDNTEKFLSNTNCLNLAQIKYPSFWDKITI